MQSAFSDRTILSHVHLIGYLLGIREYSKIGIISNNRWEWAALAAAASSLNAAIVPVSTIFPSISQIFYVIEI